MIIWVQTQKVGTVFNTRYSVCVYGCACVQCMQCINVRRLGTLSNRYTYTMCEQPCVSCVTVVWQDSQRSGQMLMIFGQWLISHHFSFISFEYFPSYFTRFSTNSLMQHVSVYLFRLGLDKSRRYYSGWFAWLSRLKSWCYLKVYARWSQKFENIRWIPGIGAHQRYSNVRRRWIRWRHWIRWWDQFRRWCRFSWCYLIVLLLRNKNLVISSIL